ncbi:beta-1,6-N-acetylglucosaminyltransferase [uncultured Sphingomonas sp.]|uniref:beta-1,6-N-acetylglucosaminyltransferase n=1 Tax=uncultured Sphingomonas sp. TaxID=158754 RepID=UPI002598A8FA|nr:beta-1,6-N-acetylglucosaminyltransferase [uncultured Sphingomonas sp.]
MPPHPPIGFVILSHRAPDQLLRLIRTLGELYGNPPIACHHDFGQAPLDRSRFPANVRFVDDWVATGWGKWSVVDAFLRALALLYADGGPDWFVLLSGADYPVRQPDAVLAELRDSGCDAFIDVHQIEPAPAAATLTGDINPMLRHLDRAESLRTKWGFYLARQFWLPILRRRPRWRPGRLTIRLPWTQRGPFRDGFSLWWGEHWFTGNRRVADVFLQPTPAHRALQRHLRWRAFPEESYYQTVLCNTPGLVLNRNNKRFTEWNGGGAHPMTLGPAEVPTMLASGMHFARKFDDDSAALDLIDHALSAAGR